MMEELADRDNEDDVDKRLDNTLVIELEVVIIEELCDMKELQEDDDSMLEATEDETLNVTGAEDDEIKLDEL